MGYPKEAAFETLRSIAFGSIGANYTAVGAAFSAPIRLLGITNLTDVDLYFSDDGVNNKVIIPAGAGKVFDVSTNRTIQENLFLSQGQYGWIKHTGSAPTSGSCYIETIIGV